MVSSSVVRVTEKDVAEVLKGASESVVRRRRASVSAPMSKLLELERMGGGSKGPVGGQKSTHMVQGKNASAMAAKVLRFILALRVVRKLKIIVYGKRIPLRLRAIQAL